MKVADVSVEVSFELEPGEDGPTEDEMEKLGREYLVKEGYPESCIHYSGMNIVPMKTDDQVDRAERERKADDLYVATFSPFKLSSTV